MTTLEQVTQLKQQGMTDEEIATNLQQQGISPKEITDAINQANIKNAVAGENPNLEPPSPQDTPPLNQTSPPSAQESQVMPVQNYPQSTEQYQNPQEAYAGQAYPAQGTYQYSSQGQTYNTDSSIMIEIANQVFSDKSKKIQNQIEDLNELKTLAKTKINSIDERLKKIEKIIDTLQIKILEKVSYFGRDIESAKKEISMLEDSVGKITKNISSKKSSKNLKQKKSSSKTKK